MGAVFLDPISASSAGCPPRTLSAETSRVCWVPREAMGMSWAESLIPTPGPLNFEILNSHPSLSSSQARSSVPGRPESPWESMACSLRVFVTSATKPKKTISGFWPQAELCRFWLCGLTPHCELNPESTREGRAACEGNSASSGPEACHRVVSEQ